MSVIVRKGEGERYELISGHRRKYACAKLGIDTLPVIVRDLSREEAIIFMVDSNLHREHILPSERAKAYQMKMDALKKRAGRPSKNNLTPMVSDFRTDEMIGAENGEKSVVGKYATATLFAGDYLFSEKITGESKSDFRSDY